MAGIPASIHFILDPSDFPVCSYAVEPLALSDHEVTLEKGSFAFSFEYGVIGKENPMQVEMVREEIRFTTKVGIRTKWLSLDPNRIADRAIRYYWLSNTEGGFPIGEYASSFIYRKDKAPSYNETEVTCGWRSIREEWESRMPAHIRELQLTGRIPQEAISFVSDEVLMSLTYREDQGITLPSSFLGEYAFRLVIYTNATVKPSEIPARFVLTYKNAIFIGSLRIDPQAIAYCTISLPFVLLIARFAKPLSLLTRTAGKSEG